MRKEVSDWITQAKQDYDDAIYSFNGQRYSLAAFLCQQAVEKALKALFLSEKRRALEKSHSLIFLAENTSVPKKYYSFLGELTPKFITTRYPDVAGELPSKIYQKENTSTIMEQSKEVLAWIKKKLFKDS